MERRRIIGSISFVTMLKACAKKKDLSQGTRMHADIRDSGLLERNICLGNTLVSMYAKCGALDKAQEVVDELPVRNVVSWNALIAGYVQHGHGKKALGCFHRMRNEGLPPDAITYSCILKACGLMQDAVMGKQIHDEIVNLVMLKKDVVLGNALVDMYAKCGVLMEAQKVLDELSIRNVISWSALIAGYAQQGQGQTALGCFQQMQREGLSANAITYACILKACGITQDIDMGKQIHDEIVSQGLLKKDIVLGNALVDMYVKCGVLTEAQRVLDELPLRDVVSWNALIAGYAQQQHCQGALACFQRMRNEGLSPDIVSWNALIGGHAQQGLADEALDYFQLMQQEGLSPNAITFVSVLYACGHSGLLDEGLMFFDNMREEYGITPDVEHYTCMVALFGFAGCFDKAMRVIKMMPSSHYPSVWSALLGACLKWENVKLAKLAFQRTVQLDGCNGVAYVLMSNIYTAAGMQQEAHRIECMRLKRHKTLNA